MDNEQLSADNLESSRWPFFTDLRAIADELSLQPRYARTATIIRQAAVAQSCLSDLREAATCAQTLYKILDARGGSLGDIAIEAALFRSCVILYERACAANGKLQERGAIKIVSALTPEQTLDHELIVQLRNRFFAHVYSAEVIDGAAWSKDCLFAYEVDGSWLPAAARRNIQFRRSTFDRVARQIPVALALVQARFQKRIDMVASILNEHPVPQEVFLRHRFEPVSVFGSAEVVQQVVAGRPAGTISIPLGIESSTGTL